MRSTKPTVGVKLNLVLLSYLCISFIVSALFDSKFEEKVPWDMVREAWPVGSVVIAILLGFVLLIWGAKLFEIFWNRLISDLFGLREITFQEAMSMVLGFSIFIFSI